MPSFILHVPTISGCLHSVPINRQDLGDHITYGEPILSILISCSNISANYNFYARKFLYAIRPPTSWKNHIFCISGFSALCVLSWGLAMHYLVDIPEASLGDDKCWKGYSNYPYIWILAGPMTAALFVSKTVELSNRNRVGSIIRQIWHATRYGKDQKFFFIIKRIIRLIIQLYYLIQFLF